MRLLITGGSGFIGSNFILYWLRNYPSDEIVNLDALTYAACQDNLKEIENNPQYKFVKGDICDSIKVNEVMTGTDSVIHFAAESHVDRSLLDPSQFVRTNVLGTQILLDSALQNRVKHFHHISTDEVFGSLPLGSQEKFTEKTNYDPRSPYSASKAGSDFLVRAYYHSFGLPVTITNCSNNFGPYQFPEKFIPLAVTNLLEGKKIPVYGDGLNVRDWLHVEDHCRAIDLVLQKGKIGETYCVGGQTADENNLSVIKKILKILGRGEDEIEFVKDRPGHDRRYAIDWTKIKTDLGWEPQYDFDNWLTKTVHWYRENDWWWKPLKGKNFQEYYNKQYGQ